MGAYPHTCLLFYKPLLWACSSRSAAEACTGADEQDHGGSVLCCLAVGHGALFLMQLAAAITAKHPAVSAAAAVAAAPAAAAPAAVAAGHP